MEEYIAHEWSYEELSHRISNFNHIYGFYHMLI